MIERLLVQILLHALIVSLSKNPKLLQMSWQSLTWQQSHISVNEWEIERPLSSALGYHEAADKLYKHCSLTKEDSGNCSAQGQSVAALSLQSLFLVFGLQGETLRPTIAQSTNVTGPLWISTSASLSLKLVNSPTWPFRQQSPAAKCQAESSAFATSRGQRSN